MDIYSEITNRIIAQMESGCIPWHKPWVSGKAVSHVTGKSYSLLNQMLLGKPGEYLTFKQCQQEGGKIRKGEKSSMGFLSLVSSQVLTHTSTGETQTQFWLSLCRVSGL